MLLKLRKIFTIISLLISIFFFTSCIQDSTTRILPDLTGMTREEIKAVLEEEQIKRPILKNCLKAFIIGGFICLFGEGLLWLFNDILLIKNENSQILMSITIVLITAILTGLGVFDFIGEHAGAGTIIPITGFANSMTSSALESKSEGIVLGILTNIFKLAGAVVATGVISAFFIGTIIYLFRV